MDLRTHFSIKHFVRAPAKGRFMWVRCKPDSKDANCIEQKGPWIDLPKSGVNRILPPNADPEHVQIKYSITPPTLGRF
uniref:Uncharacterized protein n=1 Tax=Erpetoichthys calabaricus TaxID=27687 RepID=A0A8C4RI90_ERPCA